MNKVVLMGRLTRDPEVRTSQGGNATTIARYTLAVERRIKRDGDASADFLNCIVFGKGAEFAEKYFKQGTKIVVSGRIQTGSYTNKEGQKVYTTDIVVEEQDFAESKNSSSGKSNANPVPGSAPNDGFTNIPDDMDDEELPFNQEYQETPKREYSLSWLYFLLFKNEGSRETFILFSGNI